MSTSGEKLAQGLADLIAASLVAERRGGQEGLRMIDIAVGRLGNAFEEYTDDLADEVSERLLIAEKADQADEEDAGQPWLRTFDAHDEQPPPDGRRSGSQYVTGVGQRLANVHSPGACAGRNCVIHNPSDHHMRGWPTNWRHGGFGDIMPPHMERMCEHGVGHPDPDDLAFHGSAAIGVHGCDGCCARPEARFEHDSPYGGVVRGEDFAGLPAVGAYLEDSLDVTWKVEDYDVGQDAFVLRSMNSLNTVTYPRGLMRQLMDLGAYRPYDDFGR